MWCIIDKNMSQEVEEEHEAFPLSGDLGSEDKVRGLSFVLQLHVQRSDS